MSHLGPRIDTLEELENAARLRMAVICPTARATCWRKPRPAAVVLNQQGTTILRLIRSGLYRYDKGGAK